MQTKPQAPAAENSRPADTTAVTAAALQAVPYQRSSQYGGTGGNPFSDDLTEVCRLSKLVIRSGARVDAITAVWELSNGTTRTGTRHGGTGGNEQTITFTKGETIIRVEGRSGSELDQITFFTSDGRKFGPYGGGGGNPFTFTGSPVNGFFGRSADRVDAIGFFTTVSCG